MGIEDLIFVAVLGGAGWGYWRYVHPKVTGSSAPDIPVPPPIPVTGGGNVVPIGFQGGNSGAGAPTTPTATPAPVASPSNPTTVTAPALSNGSFRVQPLFDLIKRAEAGPKGYDSYYSAVKLAPPKRPTTMTLNEVQAWQQAAIAAGSVSVAIGHFQIVSRTLSGLKSSLGLNGSELFNKALQDRMGIQLMEEVGLRSYEKGSMSLQQFGNKLARVWAGFPVLTDQQGHTTRVTRGQSYYAEYTGNKATVSATQFEAALRQMKG